MTAITSLLRVILSLAGMAAFLWLVATAADHSWPAAKWFLIAFFVGVWLFAFGRQSVIGVSECAAEADAFVDRRIDTAKLPAEFQSITRNKTLQQVLEQFGPPSRKTKLVARNAGVADSKAQLIHFVAYEYDLPYEAAVIVMPELPCEPQSKIRAVYFHPRSNEDEFFAPVRS